LDVGIGVPSVKCKRCGAILDLQDYRVYDVGSKRIKTKGAFIVEPRGYLYNSEAMVGEAIIKGRFHGVLLVEHSLTIYSSAQIQGRFIAGHFIIPAAHRFRWPRPIEAGSAVIAGELNADLYAAGTIVLKSTARMFGSVEAGHLVVEAGAVVVGPARVSGGKGNRSLSMG
jgi:cytoskeletal protein CcmA (bactofilin family)